MRVGIFSDTHDNLNQVDRAIAYFADRKVEAVLHAGDIVAPFSAKVLATIPVPLHVVFGNNDGEKVGLKNVLPQIRNGPLELRLGGKVIVMAHDFGQIPPDWRARADVLVAGHTHIVSVTREDRRLLINPGECGGWLKHRSTVAILDTETNQAEIIDLPI